MKRRHSSTRKRRELIIDRVREQGRVYVEELADLFDASRETIRRDVNVLAAEGTLRKFHGGVELPNQHIENSFQIRMAENTAAKRAIGDKAATLFQPNDSLFIDTGTTTLYFAEALARVHGLTIITNSATIAKTISVVENGNHVFLLGGEFNGGNEETFGTLVIEQMRIFRTRYAVLTIGALDPVAGAMDFNIEEAQVARAMIEQAESVCVLADSSKFNRLGLVEVCSLNRFDHLVTETQPGEPMNKALADANVELIVVNSTESSND